MTKSNVKHASYTDKTKMHELMSKYLHPVTGTDYYRYEDTWNDDRIAKSINKNFSKWHVQTLRVEVFGKLKARGQSANLSKGRASATRITALENQIRRLIIYCGCNAQETANILGNAENNGSEKES